MAVKPDGEKLIFIISQPRSGSTLLQKILGSHPDISTSVEPWLLLPLVYILKDEGVKSEFNQLNSSMNILEFIDSVPSGRQYYQEGVKQIMCNLYNAAMPDPGNYFLDKTPRYYLIIPELAEMFPQARFIFLFRNPVSVLASMHTTWGSVFGLLSSSLKPDLLKAPGLLVQGKSMLGKRAISIHYEALTTNPEKEIKTLCDWLSVPFQPAMIQYGDRNTDKWGLGDQKTVYENKSPVTGNIDKWTGYIKTAQHWRYARGYLDRLGAESVEALGYSFDDLGRTLDEHRPPLYRRIWTFPFIGSMYIHYILRRVYRLLLGKEPIL